MDTVRIGCVKFLNTLPLIQGLAAWRDAELISAVPARQIDMLLSREVDLALCSLIDFARAPEPLTLLPVSMIGCDGPTLTVRLFSSVPAEKITTLYADTDSHTSVALAQVILWRRYNIRPRVIDFDARERVALGPAAGQSPEWPETILLIGDKIVTDSPPAVRYPHQIDLGAAWKELTGLPFMYATWMCRAAALEDEGSTRRVRTAAAVLDRALRHNTTRADWLVAAEAPARGWPRDVATHYFRDCLRHEVGERERQAAQRFLNEAAELGVCPRAEARWVEIG